MGLEDSRILGNLPDDIVGEETSSEANERNLFHYNQSQLIISLDRHISQYELKFLLDEVKDSNDEFWIVLLKRLISVYSLNSLKQYLSEGFRSVDLKYDIIRLLIFIKTILIMFINNGYITKDMDRKLLGKVFEQKLKNTEIPKLMKDVLLYSDNSSLNIFLNTIIKEAKMSYLE